MISATELRTGVVFKDNGHYFLVLTYEHSNMGRGSGNIKVKVRDLSTSATIDKSFITGAKVKDVFLARKKVQYLYKDNNGFHFMDLVNYDQLVLDERLVSDFAKFLKDGMEVSLFVVGEEALYVEIAKVCEYKVSQTGGSDRGNTVGASYKDAVLENGLVVKVPLFIKVGETIKVNTETGLYGGRG